MIKLPWVTSFKQVGIPLSKRLGTSLICNTIFNSSCPWLHDFLGHLQFPQEKYLKLPDTQVRRWEGLAAGRGRAGLNFTEQHLSLKLHYLRTTRVHVLKKSAKSWKHFIWYTCSLWDHQSKLPGSSLGSIPWMAADKCIIMITQW